jgi:hypothetical protein
LLVKQSKFCRDISPEKINISGSWHGTVGDRKPP